MIYLDRREPDELEKAIRYLGVEVTAECDMKFGDIMFEGNGERGPGAMVGIERKKLSDLVNSMKDRRLSGHQLRGCWQTFDYVYLVCEGIWRPGPSGEIQHQTPVRVVKGGKWVNTRDYKWEVFYGHVDRKSVAYRHLAGFLHSLTLRSRSPRREPLRVLRTSSVQETAAQVVSLYKNFNERAWGEHYAHDVIYDGGLPIKQHGGEWAHPHNHDGERDVGKYEQENPNTCWRMLSQLPGVDRKAREIAKYFGTPFDMALAGLDPRLRKAVDAWFEGHPEVVVKVWQEAFGVVKGRAKAEAAIRAVKVRGA